MSEMTPLFDRTHYHVHLDPNRPPMTKKEVVELSQLIGGIKRARRTIENAMKSILKFEDRAEKPSDSGLPINSGIKCLHQAKYWLVQSIDVLECARKYAKDGK
jgi:hypothetical protein